MLARRTRRKKYNNLPLFQFKISFSTFNLLMKPRRFIRKCFAIILLIVFVQKGGVELYLHNWLHTNNCKQSVPQSQDNNVASRSCNCIDDFSMPFTESLETPKHVIFSSKVESVGFQKCSTPSIHIFFCSLRGPPVSVS